MRGYFWIRCDELKLRSTVIDADVDAEHKHDHMDTRTRDFFQKRTRTHRAWDTSLGT